MILEILTGVGSVNVLTFLRMCDTIRRNGTRKFNAKCLKTFCWLLMDAWGKLWVGCARACRRQAFRKRRLTSSFSEGSVFDWPKNLGTCVGRVEWMVGNANTW